MPDIEDYQRLLNQNNDKSVDLNKVNPYDLVRHAYHGTGGFMDGEFLLNHTREKDFAERKGYSFYPNHFKPIIDALVNPIYKNPPERENINDSQEWFVFDGDCDAKGTKLTNFMRRAATRAKRDGVLFLVMDNVINIPSNFSEAMEQRALPYIYWKNPTDVVYYKTDNFGGLAEIAFKELSKEAKSNEKDEYQYRLWYRGGWQVYSKFEKGEFKEMVDSGILPFDELPIVQIMTGDPEENPVLPMPPLYSIARINTAIYNLWSEYREIQRRIGFPILARPVDDVNSPSAVEMGAGTILDYPMESSKGPEFIQPGNEVLESIMSAIQDLKEEMYKQAGLSGVTGVIELSGRAKEWDNLATQNHLSDFARELERAENRIVYLFGLWLGKDVNVNIKYSESFGIDDFGSDIENAERMLEMNCSTEVNQEVKKGLVRSYFSYMDAEDIGELEETVKAEEIDEQQANAEDNED